MRKTYPISMNFMDAVSNYSTYKILPLVTNKIKDSDISIWNNINIRLGISYSDHESLCQRRIDSEKQVEEKRIQKDAFRKVCPYADCNSLEAKNICAEECVGSK